MKLHHLGIAVKSIKESCSFYENSLGWVIRSKVYYDPIQSVNVQFLGDENDILYELIEPVDLQSPVANFLNKRISLYHFCYEVIDINQSIKDLINSGFLLISGPSESVTFNGKQIAFIINQDNLTIELVER